MSIRTLVCLQIFNTLYPSPRNRGSGRPLGHQRLVGRLLVEDLWTSGTTDPGGPTSGPLDPQRPGRGPLDLWTPQVPDLGGFGLHWTSGPPGTPWDPLGPLGTPAWDLLGPPGTPWDPLGPPGTSKRPLRNVVYIATGDRCVCLYMY